MDTEKKEENAQEKEGFQNLADIFKEKLQAKGKIPYAEKIQSKSPKLQWQHLALKVLRELDIPNFKRGAVFKVCKDKPSRFIEMCLIDTKELCSKGEQWKYFFKIAMSPPDTKPKPFENKKTS